MTIQVVYEELKQYLIEELRYTEKDAVRSIQRLRDADQEIQSIFVHFWTNNGEIPESTESGKMIHQLIKYRHFNPIAAILTTSDMKKKPENILWGLARSIDARRTTKREKELLLDLAEKNDWDLENNEPIEDFSDLLINTEDMLGD